MNLLELDSYDLADAVKFNQRLNPRIWNKQQMRPEVRNKLLEIAADFKESLGLLDLDVKDITVSGSNAGYTYTPYSDIDLHLVVDIPRADEDEVYRELFDAKKFQYNQTHNIKIGGYDVELYVENANKPPVSQGVFSVLNNDWIHIPRRRRATVDDDAVRSKYEDYQHRIDDAVNSKDSDRITALAKKIKTYRQAGLDAHGELGSENLAYKMLRNQGYIKKLHDARAAARDAELSLAEQNRVRQPFVYGHKKVEEDASTTPDGVNPTTCMFLNEENPNSDEDILLDFIDFVSKELKLKQMPTIKLRRDPQWSVVHKTFGRYINDKHLLEVAWGQRHIMDVLRTVAHELTHKHQHERDGARMGPDAGETGSPWENEANARAGILMRDYARLHPEYFAVGQAEALHGDEIKESASGYIPTKRQARDSRYSMALTVDIKPGQVGKEANKLKLKTDSQGHPQVANPNGLFEQLAMELREFKEQDLFEIKMSTSNLRQEAAKTGALAGMEFEMIVPNVESDPEDFESEPDYDNDERCRSIEDACNFFYDGDYNGRRDIDRLREKMIEDYHEWLDNRIEEEWDRQSEEYILEWVKNNVDEDEWNPDELEGDARNEALEEFAANVDMDSNSDYNQQARDEFRDENSDAYDESDWLDDENLHRMSNIQDTYDITWPYWTQPDEDAGEAEISDVAQDFENAIGRDTFAADSYHSSGTLRPSPSRIRYVVEPDSSLEGDNPGDRGLEFVSPPLPIDEILSDLNKVKAWAKAYGCYTNDSTGLHINISVPNYSRENLDFIKLALLMGDKYVLDLFGRSGNTYAKSAFDIVKRAVRDQPEEAEKLLDKMKGNLDSLATKAIHSGITNKYTSINTKEGHIEFRSPGGDWLDQNFDQIENTLLRFTVAMSAALNPEMYRQEYLTKLYKLLSENNKDVDTIKYFSDYVAGKIPKAALRSFVKQAQLERRLKRDPTEGERYWWRVDKEGRGRDGASIELVAASKKEALEKAREEWRIPAGDAAMRRAEAYPLRPYTDTQQTDTGGGLTLNGRPSNPDGRYVIVPEQDRQTVYYRFQAAGPDDAAIVLRQWRQEYPGRIWLTLRDDNGVLGQPQGTATPRFGLWDFSEGGFIDNHGAVGQGGQLIGGDSFDTAREAARRNGLVSRIDMGEVEIRRIPQQQSGAGTYELFDRRTGEAIPNEEFPARNQGEANTRLQDYIDFGPHGVSQTDAPMAFGVRPVSSAGQQQGQGNWGIWVIGVNRFAREPGEYPAGQEPPLYRFDSRDAAVHWLEQQRAANSRMRTDLEVREIEPSSSTSRNALSQTDIENRLGWPDQTGDANYEVVNRRTQQPVFRFIANTDQDAARKYSQYLDVLMLPHETEDYGFRAIATPIPGSTIDLQRRRAAAATDNVFGITGQGRSDTAQGGIIDVAPDVAQNFPSVGRELRGWKIVDLQGNTLHEFGGVGNVQADANTYALGWLRRNPEHMQTGVEVVPNWVEA